MPILTYQNIIPKVPKSCFIAPNAYIIGDVELGEDCSVWYGTVIRGDVFPIRLGHRVNVQDNSVIHVTTGKYATHIGDDVTIGHRAIIHGCTLESGSLVGMGSIIMDKARLGQGALLAAGSVLTEGVEVDAGHLALGSPARVKRMLHSNEVEYLQFSAQHYVEISKLHAESRIIS